MHITKRVFTVTIECADTPDGQQVAEGYAVTVEDKPAAAAAAFVSPRRMSTLKLDQTMTCSNPHRGHGTNNLRWSPLRYA